MGCGQPSIWEISNLNVESAGLRAVGLDGVRRQTGIGLEQMLGDQRSQLFLDALKVTLEAVMGDIGQNDSETEFHCEQSEQHATAEAGAVEKPLIPRVGMKGLSFAAH